MNLKLGIPLLFLFHITAINCWVELDIAGNDLAQPNPEFVKPDEACDNGEEEGIISLQNMPGGGKSKSEPKADEQTMKEVENYAKDLDAGKKPEKDQDEDNGKKSKGKDGKEEDCFTSPATVIELPQMPRLRMLKSKKEDEKENIERQTLETTECTEIIDMEPRTSIKIETFTVPSRDNREGKTVTRKVIYIQRRRKIKRIVQKPILIIKRKIVKDRQFFERIIPKMIETREVINKPEVKVILQEGPMEPLNPEPTEEEECEEPTTTKNPCEQYMGAGGGDFGGAGGGDYGDAGGDMNYQGYGGGVGGGGNYNQPRGEYGYDFNSALNHGIKAAFAGGANQQRDEVVQPQQRSIRGTTERPPGMVDNALGSRSYGSPYQQGNGQSNIYAQSHNNAYGQPVLSFQKKK